MVMLSYSYLVPILVDIAFRKTQSIYALISQIMHHVS